MKTKTLSVNDVITNKAGIFAVLLAEELEGMSDYEIEELGAQFARVYRKNPDHSEANLRGFAALFKAAADYKSTQPPKAPSSLTLRQRLKTIQEPVVPKPKAESSQSLRGRLNALNRAAAAKGRPRGHY